MSKILDPRRHTWCATSADDFGLIVDGDDYYREFYRVASQARRRLLLAGWQFDSDVALLRGPDAENAEYPVTLLKFLNALCEKTPELEIYILAWDYHVIFAIEREWLQGVMFEWTTSERLRFLFDSRHAERASHHQKFVVADGEVAFLGGLDLCDHRWDDRKHRQKNPLRVSRGEPHKPFHDVQAYVRGPEVARALTDLFVCRWQRAGGEPIAPLPASVTPTALLDYRPENLVPIDAREITLSRTDPDGSPTGVPGCTEIRDLYADAIDAAERLIYIETQYFSGRAAVEALVRRMRAEGRSVLDVVIVLNMKAETIKEEIAVGLAQAKNIGELRDAAAATGHRLGIYYTTPTCEDGETPERATYIHSKLMIVDDRFLTVGSANLTNRSLSIDTEINASVETQDPGDALGRSIRAARAVLLEHHVGVASIEHDEGLVAYLDEMARPGGGSCRLALHPSPTDNERAALALIDPQKLPFDPGAIESDGDEDRATFTGAADALKWQASRKL